MICVPAEIRIDDKSILAQMERVTNAQRELEKEMDDLRRLIFSTKVKEKRDSEESRAVNEWLRLFQEKSQELRNSHEESE